MIVHTMIFVILVVEHWLEHKVAQMVRSTGVTKTGMCYLVCGMVHIKELLLLIGKNSPCGSSGFPLSLSEWSFAICLDAI